MAFTHDPAFDRTLTLADGRVLGYSEFGDVAGYPMLNNDGGLVCRLDAELAHANARSMGVRIISPDRPGVATSDRKPGRDTLDWADDVGELLDALGIDELANMGWSMGGQYALGVAHRFPGRVCATKPWRFAPEDVAGPVTVWQGSADNLVPAAWGQRLADRIPGAVLHPVEGEGHLIGLTRRAEIMRDLVDVVRASRR